MTGEELIAEGQKLAKPCVYLVDSPDSNGIVAAVWGGKGVLPSPGEEYRHWLSVDCAFLPGIAYQGVFSIYTNEDDYETGTVILDDETSLDVTNTEGIFLYAKPALSLPPLNAIFKFGSSSVQEWLKANDWLPEEDEEDNSDCVPMNEATQMYLDVWQDQLPLYSGGAYAVLGGWHMPWPDGDWYALLSQTLIAWTFEDSEPWVEVWQDTEKNFSVYQRIT